MQKANFDIKSEQQLRANAGGDSADKNAASYFPFIGSEKIEQKRIEMNDQLKTDLKSFMNYKRSQRTRQSSQMGWTHDKISNIRSEDSVKDAYYKNSNKAVKHLYDSSYMKPNENYRVVQDDNPVKAAIMDQALKRHEQEMEMNTNFHNQNLNLHYHKVNSDFADFERERMAKRQRQADFASQIGMQVEENVSDDRFVTFNF